jgi:predicted amidophosphoribosyltransferase
MEKKILTINPIILKGNWTRGWALDFHTISSKYDKSGRYYKTKRTALGEALYRLKYKKRWWWAKIIAEKAASFLDEKNIIDEIDLITTIPPARFRLFFQPVNLIGKFIGKFLGIPVKIGILKRNKKVPAIKSMEDIAERFKAVKGLFTLTSKDLSGRNVLIFDDLYRSGATLREAAAALKTGGNAGEIYVLTITRTRVNR